jgi:oligosaccharide reducing-end xylanase
MSGPRARLARGQGDSMKFRTMFVSAAAILAVAFMFPGCSAPKKAVAAPAGSEANYFASLLGKSEAETKDKLDRAWTQLFHGDPDRESVYYPVGADMAYVMDIGSNDVRTEGMSYGMMIAVQLDKHDEFDRIWKWAATYMRNDSGTYRGYFAWHCRPDGTKIDANPASDGEEYFATALFFASGRWGDGEGIYNYRKEAQAILDTMLHTAELGDGAATNMFDAKAKQVVFVPTKGPASEITDPSYHLPHFYELWALWADKDNAFWKKAAAASRAFWKKAADGRTGLMSDYARFDGKPTDMYNGNHEIFAYDAWRVGMNVAIDYQWFKGDAWEVKEANRLLAFFAKQGPASYGNRYKLSGEQVGGDHSLGLVSTNAVAATVATVKDRKAFLEALWNAEPPAGQWRYYDGMLYLLSMLGASGNYRIYAPK